MSVAFGADVPCSTALTTGQTGARGVQNVFLYDRTTGANTLVSHRFGPGSGNGIETNFGLCNARIDRNKFSGDTSSSVLIFGPPVSGLASNINVTNNELAALMPESISFLGVSDSAITGNISTGSTNLSTIDLFPNFKRSLVERLGLLELACGTIQHGQVVQADCHFRMFLTMILLMNGQ